MGLLERQVARELVVDAAVGTVKIGGKAIGKTADVVFGRDPAPAP